MKKRVWKLLGAGQEQQLIIWDLEGFSELFDYQALLIQEGFALHLYEDVEAFRYLYEAQLRDSHDRFAVIIKQEIFVPYDIKAGLRGIHLNLGALYPRLNAQVLAEHNLDIGLFDAAYDKLYETLASRKQTEGFLANVVLSKENIQAYLRRQEQELLNKAKQASHYQDWIAIAKENANLAFYSAAHGLARETQAIQALFASFIATDYDKLSSVVNATTPAILTKTLETIATGKTALIVVDGMSLTDFEIIKREAWPFESRNEASFALIPTTTSISRQSLLTDRYPQQIENPFSLAKEESGFYEAAERLGYKRTQASYGRGHEVQIGNQVQLIAIILNDIDDIMHGQLQGDVGMAQDVRLFARKGRLQQLIAQLMERGFAVYLTSDHGHLTCQGNGITTRFGLETESKAQRVLVLKDFAEASDALRDATTVFPGTYLNRSFQYLIAKEDTAFAAEGKQLVTHGGISIEEVIVPFIRVLGVK